MSQFTEDLTSFLGGLFSLPASIFADAVGEVTAPIVRTALLFMGVGIVGYFVVSRA